MARARIRSQMLPLPQLCGLLLLSVPLACSDAPAPTDPEILVTVGTIALDEHNSAVVVLEEEDGPRVLPIWIGTAEAGSIAAQIERHTPPRPNFHDLAQRVIQTLDASVDRVVVTELRGGTFFALLHLRRDGNVLAIDVRPSDGIAVALRTRAPILVRASVFDAAGAALGGGEREGRRIDAPTARGSAQATDALSL